ncbi:MAG: HlyC/CorC family transporter [Hyphomicrobiales bacterium]|nr:HlyC/CorC family transporter [Hyphomicrobiales bacterium]MDE2115126.1 HlyC/CorC family transporter [Hyphomicrobiales bacterium]
MLPSLATAGLSGWVALPVVAVCMGFSGFFSGAETALTAASRARLFSLEKSGDARARRVILLLEDRARFIGTMLLGNTLSNITASAIATNSLVDIFGPTGVLYAAVTMTVLLLIFSEVLPKTLAIAYPDRASLLIAPLASFFVAMLGPVLASVEWVVRLTLRIFGVVAGDGASAPSGHEELKSTVDLMHRDGEVARADRDMVGGLLDLRDLHVSDVMIHRTKMRMIDVDLPPGELVREVLASAYTRIPLWRGETENIIGVLHAKDLLRALAAVGGDTNKINVAEIALQPWFVPDTTGLQDQLQAFLRRKTHFALVVDEYGSVMGLVTLEDILEEIVGDISDEHDLNVAGVRILPDGSVHVEGSVPIRDLNRVMDWQLPDEEATTIAGLVIHEARTIPEVGQIFTFYNFRFEVLRKVRNRIAALRIKALAPAGNYPPDLTG